MSSMPLQRSNSMMARPVKLSKAFNDPAQIMALVERGAPYKTITAVQKNPANNSTPGWFRNFWALGEKVIFEGAEEAFYNPNFIEAAKRSFSAKIVQPLAMMTNLNVPAPASPVHLDLPFFRGTHQREVPSWMLAPMGYSGLFQAWAIPVASAISWFYDGQGGDFEYWPDGLQQTSQVVSPPYSNTSVIADNEYMYHRVGQMGDQRDYLAGSGIPSEALLHRTIDGWDIRLGDESIRCYSERKVRVSILWKAYCFKNQAEADQFRDPTYNLTPQMIVDIFCENLLRKGLDIGEPTSLENDKTWRNHIIENYNSPDGSAY